MARSRRIPDNGQVTDLPRRAVSRTAKLATLPLGFAGRTALGLGKRVGGKPAEAVARPRAAAPALLPITAADTGTGTDTDAP